MLGTPFARGLICAWRWPSACPPSGHLSPGSPPVPCTPRSAVICSPGELSQLFLPGCFVGGSWWSVKSERRPWRLSAQNLCMIRKVLVDAGLCFGCVCQNGLADVAASLGLVPTPPKNPINSDTRSDEVSAKTGGVFWISNFNGLLHCKGHWRTVGTTWGWWIVCGKLDWKNLKAVYSFVVTCRHQGLGLTQRK